MARKFDWSRTTPTRSVAESNGVEMSVECDSSSVPSCEWTVHGWANTRQTAIERSEEAALAAIVTPPATDEQIDALLALTQTGAAYMVVNGQRDQYTLFNILRRLRNNR